MQYGRSSDTLLVTTGPRSQPLDAQMALSSFPVNLVTFHNMHWTPFGVGYGPN